MSRLSRLHVTLALVANWQVQTAKQRFSEVIRAAEKGEPQFITRHGQEVAVVVDIAEYRATHPDATSPTLIDALLSGPRSDEIDLPRRTIERDPTS